MHYSNPSRGGRSQATKMSAHSVSALRERYNLRQRTENPFDSRFQMPSARQRAHNFPSSHSRGMADSLKKYTTRVKKSSTYSPDSAVLDSSPFLPSQSHSAHTYSRDVSPSYKQRRANTSPSPMEDLDDSVYNALNQQRIDNSSSPFLSMRNSQKQFQTSTDDVPNYHQPYYPYPGAELSKNTLLSKASAAARLKASHISGNLGLKTDYEPPDDFDLDGSPEAPLSNKAFHAQLQFQKMDFKVDNIFLSPNWVFLLSKYYDDVLNVLKSKLRENIDLYLNQGIATLRCVHVDLVKSLLENDLTMIDHDFNQQSLLKSKVKKWENLIDSLHNKFFCVIISEEDFSKTYVCTTEAESESILSEIAKFLDQSPSDIKISPHVMEFVRHNKEFSDLKLDETAQDGIWIRSIRKPRLAKLKAEIRKVTCQSYLLDENQYELLCEEKKEVLSYLEKKFQMKGSPYQLPLIGDIPVVFQLNPLTSISCIVNSDPENIPVDSLISVEWQTPQSKSGIPVEIYQYSKWESPARQHFYVPVSEYDTTDEEWMHYFNECLAKVFSEDIPPVTIGISLPLISVHFKNICARFLNALQALWGKSMIPFQCYVILIVPTKKMKSLAEKLLKTLPVKNPSSPHEGLSDSSVLTKSFAVKVVLGNLADQQVDVIVNSTNQTLNLKYGKISSSLLKKAGSALQKECSNRYPKGIIYPEFAVTQGYKLPCKCVLHGALPPNNVNMVIKKFVYECLKFTVKYQFSSIAFPALGTGVLNYPISQVVQQMNEAFKRFETHHSESSLQEIRIVLYSEDTDLVLFYELDNSQKGSSGAGMIQEQSKEYPPKFFKWIQLVNYSCTAENLPLAIRALEEQLKQPTVSSVQIPLEEFEDVFFFKELRSVIPNIVQQLDSKKEKFYHLQLSAEKTEELTALMMEVKKNIHQEQLNIIQPVSGTVLDHCLLKTRQAYPQVKCIVTNSGQSVIIQSLDWNLTQKAKYFIEVWLGVKSAVSVSEDRFNKMNNLTTINDTASVSLPAETLATQNRFNKSHQEDPQPPAASASSTQGPAQNEVFTQSSQNNQDICCFQTENGLLIKVYQGDILNVDVDGIVNAANKWLHHGGGVARAIINAAGDAVNREGKEKLNGQTLNDGEVLSTSAGNLKRYKNIIHAVGPMYAPSKNDKYCLNKIALAVENSLHEAKKLKLQSLALPALSSAIFGVPMDICTKGYYVGVRMFSEKYPNSCLKEVHFVDKQDSCIKEIQNFFRSYFILIGEESNSHSNRQSPKNLSTPSSPSKAGSSSPTQKKDDTNCLICLDNMKNPTILEKCKHVFCRDCITQSLKYNPKCPLCKTSYGIETGNQPPGTMTHSKMLFGLPGYKRNGTFSIKYEIKNPVTKRLMVREAYLPANGEGMVVLKMLQLAFERRLIFTVGESRTTGAQNAITWNDIHHKTSMYGGPLEFGYPDPTYLQRVTEELADHGITPDDVANRTLQNVANTP